MKIRWLEDMPGMVDGVMDQKAGDIQEIADEQAKRYVYNGLATARLKGPLPDRVERLEEAEKFREEVERKGKEQLRQIRIQSGQSPDGGVINIGRGNRVIRADGS
jgi:hypothetical protein